MFSVLIVIQFHLFVLIRIILQRVDVDESKCVQNGGAELTRIK